MALKSQFVQETGPAGPFLHHGRTSPRNVNVTNGHNTPLCPAATSPAAQPVVTISPPPSKAQKTSKTQTQFLFQPEREEERGGKRKGDKKSAFQMLKGTRCRNRYFTGFCQMLRLLLHLVPNTPTWGGFLLPVLMLVPYITSPVRAMLFLCHQLHREGAQVFLGISNSSIEANAVSSSAGIERAPFQEKAVPWLPI